MLAGAVTERPQRQARESSAAASALLPRLWHQLYRTNLLRNPNWHHPGGGTRAWLTDPDGAPPGRRPAEPPCRGMAEGS